ncbi:class I SAM-dependent methyltransferase [Halopseudomonas sp. Lyrl_26]|uniref:class I SAM-dependent methyltransferase n=1 Tax=Halopseudomonas sp. Lyrl_26 TaxID=3110923 RepID=UPI003F81A66C
MWDQRYASDEFVYGTRPNLFLAEHAQLLTGPVLSLAEGEGRNAVYLASLGLDVLGVDASAVGLSKAHKLAEAQGVRIRTQVADLTRYQPQAKSFGSCISIFAHLPSQARRHLHRQIAAALRPNGIFLLEGYSQAQLSRHTGGPKAPDMLLDAGELAGELPDCELLLCREVEREVIEGSLHTGMASVVQLIARKTCL